MIPYVWKLALVSLLVVFSVSFAFAQKIKVIVDQDARGPGTSDQQAILVFLQSEKFDVLGITTVSGDQWVKEETQHVLRLDRKSTRLNSSHGYISYAVFCLKKKKKIYIAHRRQSEKYM